MHLAVPLNRNLVDQNGFKWLYDPMITGNNHSSHGVSGYIHRTAKEVKIEQTDQIEKYLKLLKSGKE
jgi:hypothetical protein